MVQNGARLDVQAITLAGTGFFRLWAGESVSLVGTQVTSFALPLIAVLTLHASPWDMGLLGAAGSTATLLFGLPVGVWADRYERRSLMHLANAGRCAALLAIPVLYWTGRLSVPVLFAVAFLVGALSLLFDSAMSAYVPPLVGREGLTTANSWLQGSVSVGDTAGPGLAGALVQFLSAPVAIVLDAVSYVASSAALATLPKAEGARMDDDGEQQHLRFVFAGVRLLRRDRIQGPLALAAAHFNVFTAMFFALYILYVVKVLGISPLLLGFLSTAGGLGGLLGASVSGRLARRFGYGPVLGAVYALPGVAGFLVPLAQSFGRPMSAALVGASSALWACSIVVNLVLSEAIKQAFVPHHMLGRVTATIRFVSWGVEPLGAAAGGALAASRLGLRGTMIVAAGGVATSALWPLLSGAVRRLHSLPSDSPATEGRAPDQAPALLSC